MHSEEEFYDRFCKNHFTKIEEKQDQVLELLQGDNKTPGLVEEVRGLKKVYRAVVGAIGAILVIIFAQAVDWIMHRLGS